VRWLILSVAVPFLLSAQDAGEIVRKAIQIDARNDQAARNYTFLQREERRNLDGSGQVKDRRIQTWDVTVLEGSPYRRLVARNDQPLTPEEQKHEQDKLLHSNEERRKETEAQRQRRIAEWEEKRAKQRDALKELPDAFDFRMVGEENRDGVAVWVIDGTPRKGFKGKSSMARSLFPKVNCRFWIAKRDYGWARLELETVDTVSLGLFMVRLAKGSRVLLEQKRVNDEVWLPSHMSVAASGRMFLVKGMKLDLQHDFSAYKKFQADSRIVSVQGVD
jgi:hypothetical protein